ncbi:MAG: acyltransferase [Bacteroidaceae bacterium]|nr:acyltransferase [Bacteroidaceae bacterium]
MFEKIKALKMLYRRFVPLKNELGFCGKNSIIEYPVWFEAKKNIFIEENVTIRALAHFINSPSEKITIKKYTVLAPNCTIITNSHRSTVGIPQFLLGASHINDKSADVTIEEDVWVGANTTIMSGVTLGRGCIVAAGAIVTKSVPPYALVAGFPAQIIAKNFFLDDILKHEQVLYPPSERLSREYLEELFNTYYKDKKVYGTSEGVDNIAIEKLTTLKKRRNFVEPY